jgi:hypothetical protein
MNLGSTLLTSFATAKPLTGTPQNSSVAPVSVVYNQGAAIAPAAPPVVANLAAGLYSLTYALTAANGHALNNWVTITEQVVLDGATIVRPAWEGSLCQGAADVSLLFGLNIYPMFTTHKPSTGANQAPDGGAAPVITVYRNMVATAIVPVVANPATGVYIVTLPLTAGAGWAIGDVVDLLASATIDGIAASNWFLSGGTIVAFVPLPAAEMIRGVAKRGVNS